MTSVEFRSFRLFLPIVIMVIIVVPCKVLFVELFPSRYRVLCFCYWVFISMCCMLGRNHPCRVDCSTPITINIYISIRRCFL